MPDQRTAEWRRRNQEAGGDSRPEWRKRQSDMGIRYNPVRLADSRPIGGEIVARRKPRVRRTEEEKKPGDEVSTDREDVLTMEPEDRLDWLHQALLCAGRGKVKVAVVYGIIEDARFADGAGSNVGGKIKAALLANLHLFKKEQQKLIQGDVCKRLASRDKPDGARAGAVQRGSGDFDGGVGGSGSDGSEALRDRRGSRSSGGAAAAEWGGGRRRSRSRSPASSSQRRKGKPEKKAIARGGGGSARRGGSQGRRRPMPREAQKARRSSSSHSSPLR